MSDKENEGFIGIAKAAERGADFVRLPDGRLADVQQQNQKITTNLPPKKA